MRAGNLACQARVGLLGTCNVSDVAETMTCRKLTASRDNLLRERTDQ